MTHMVLAGASLALLSVTGFAAEPERPAQSPEYSVSANWLCRPDNISFCQTNLDATVVEADGALTVERWQPPASVPQIDCFYLYPTASADMAPNSDLIPGGQPGEEIHTVRRNFARFAETCRLFAPIYRSTTVTQMRGQVPAGDRELAYADVLAAWKHYLTYDNEGRGVVLIGHSQGSGHIRRLLMEEIDGKPAQALLVSALAIGNNFTVAANGDVGGDLQNIPVCRAVNETGCLVSYNTYRAEAPPPANAVLGGRAGYGLRHVCVNPAAPDGGSAILDAYLETTYTLGADAGAGQQPWSNDRPAVTTPYVRVPGLLSARCISDDNGDYLALSINADAADPRVDDLLGEVRRGGQVLPEWGFHVIDMELVMGDLVNLVRAQAETWTST